MLVPAHFSFHFHLYVFEVQSILKYLKTVFKADNTLYMRLSNKTIKNNLELCSSYHLGLCYIYKTLLLCFYFIQDVGLEFADGDLSEYLDWCLENEQNTELIQELVGKLKAQGLNDDMTDERETGEEMDDEGDDRLRALEEEEMSFPSMAKTMQEVTQGLLKDLNRG